MRGVTPQLLDALPLCRLLANSLSRRKGYICEDLTFAVKYIYRSGKLSYDSLTTVSAEGAATWQNQP